MSNEDERVEELETEIETLEEDNAKLCAALEQALNSLALYACVARDAPPAWFKGRYADLYEALGIA